MFTFGWTLQQIICQHELTAIAVTYNKESYKTWWDSSSSPFRHLYGIIPSHTHTPIIWFYWHISYYHTLFHYFKPLPCVHICQKRFVCNKTKFRKRLKDTFWVLRRKTLVHKVDLLEKSILLPLSPSLLQATSSLVRVPNPLALEACPAHLRLRLKQAALSSANRGQAVKQTSTHLTINAWWISKRPLLIEDKLVVAFTTNNINNVENNEQHQLSTANWASITSNAIAQWISWRPYIVWQSFYTSCWCPHYRRHNRGC